MKCLSVDTDPDILVQYTMMASQKINIGIARTVLIHIQRSLRKKRYGPAVIRTRTSRKSEFYILTLTTLTRHRLYFTGSGTFDWSVDPYYSCSTSDNTLSCRWYDSLAVLQPGIPFDIPKVTASLVNVLPPDYGQPSVSNMHISDTVRLNGEWQMFDKEP